MHDLTAAFNAISSAGSNPWEPHPWGGVPGIFKQFTDEAGLNYDVSIPARNAATLRGQFLNTANATWDLRGNVASQVWNTVVLQEQSDAPLPAGKGKNANLAQFGAYADQFERFHSQRRGADLHRGGALPQPGGVHGDRRLRRDLQHGALDSAEPESERGNEDLPDRDLARPDMVFAHKITTPDPTTPDGRPIVDTSSAGGDATLHYATLAAMTQDLHASFADKLASSPRFAGVIPVGDAFQSAVDLHLANGSGFYKADGTYSTPLPGDLMNLWWDDYLHASKYGSFLDALVQFGTITGLDPLSLGIERAGRDLGISAAHELTLERVASAQLGFAAAVPEPSTWAMLAVGLMLTGRVARKRRR